MEEHAAHQEAKEAKEVEETGGEMINTTKMEEIRGQSSMALTWTNYSPNSQPVGAGDSKPGEDRDSEEPVYTPSLLLTFFTLVY